MNSCMVFVLGGWGHVGGNDLPWGDVVDDAGVNDGRLAEWETQTGDAGSRAERAKLETYIEFKKNMLAQGMAVRPVEGDGNCLFR